jgi:multiple sugar transport system substrate-binding protein
VFLANSDKVSQLLAEDRVQPVDELLEERNVEFGDAYERLGLEAFAGESALQCMPNDVSPHVVIYNEGLLDLSAAVQPGETVPDPTVAGWTWRQFALAAQAASQPGVQGVYLPPELSTLAPLLRSAGGDIVDDDQSPTTLTLDDAGSREAVAAILALARDGRVNPTPEQLRRADAVSRFEDGRLAMMIGTRAMVPRLREASGLVFDVYPLPHFGRFQTVADVTGYCISRTSEHVDAAADFLAFASGDRGARIMARSGGIVPANLSALRSRAFQQPDLSPDNVGVFTDFVRRAETLPSPLRWAEVVRRTRPLIARLFYDTVLDLEVQLAQIDEVSARVLAEPTPSPSPGD